MPAYTMLPGPEEDQVRIFQWVLTSADNEGTPIPPAYAGFSDRSVQVAGSLGGGTISWQGSNQPTPTDWANLNQATGTAAQWSQAGIKQILEAALHARPILAGSSGATCTVIAMCRKPSRT